MRIRRLMLVTGMVLALSACTPQEIIWHYFHDHGNHVVEQANRVASCESGHNPQAVSPGGGNHGLFQINNVHRQQFEAVTGAPWSERYNPVHNTRYAEYLWETQGWSPWSCRP